MCLTPEAKYIRILANPFDIPQPLRDFMTGHIYWQWFYEIRIVGTNAYMLDFMQLCEFYGVTWEIMKSCIEGKIQADLKEKAKAKKKRTA